MQNAERRMQNEETRPRGVGFSILHSAFCVLLTVDVHGERATSRMNPTKYLFMSAFRCRAPMARRSRSARLIDARARSLQRKVVHEPRRKVPANELLVVHDGPVQGNRCF